MPQQGEALATFVVQGASAPQLQLCAWQQPQSVPHELADLWPPWPDQPRLSSASSTFAQLLISDQPKLPHLVPPPSAVSDMPLSTSRTKVLVNSMTVGPARCAALLLNCGDATDQSPQPLHSAGLILAQAASSSSTTLCNQ